MSLIVTTVTFCVITKLPVGDPGLFLIDSLTVNSSSPSVIVSLVVTIVIELVVVN